MSLNPNMTAPLKLIAEATAVGQAMFMNVKSPIIRALEKDGMIVRGSAIDPTNADKAAYTASPSGLAAVNVTIAVLTPMPTQAPVPTPVLTSTESIPTPMSTTTETAVKTPRAPRAVRPAPTIAHSGARFAMPVSTGRAGRAPREEVYPFSQLAEPNAEGHDSFFVQATEHLPNPANQLASTVGSANKRFKDRGHVFKIIHVAQDVEFGVAGARIVRVK